MGLIAPKVSLDAGASCMRRPITIRPFLTWSIPTVEENADTPIEIVLDELDHLAMQLAVGHAAEEDWECRRRAWRRPFRVACDIWYFQDMIGSIRHVKTTTRNICERGLALVGKCMALKGVPIEIRILAPGRPSVFLGGIVTFCRPAAGGMHEIGVLLHVHQHTSVFHDDPIGAAVSTPWLRDALRSLAVRARAGAPPIQPA